MSSQTNRIVGAHHLYLLDYNAEHLPELKKTILERYPDVKVTTLQADASDENAIKSVCEQALREEGRLDVFFANVRPSLSLSPVYLHSLSFTSTIHSPTVVA